MHSKVTRLFSSVCFLFSFIIKITFQFFTILSLFYDIVSSLEHLLVLYERSQNKQQQSIASMKSLCPCGRQPANSPKALPRVYRLSPLFHFTTKLITHGQK